jgi:hypothetical protein
MSNWTGAIDLLPQWDFVSRQNWQWSRSYSAKRPVHSEDKQRSRAAVAQKRPIWKWEELRHGVSKGFSFGTTTQSVE